MRKYIKITFFSVVSILVLVSFFLGYRYYSDNYLATEAYGKITDEVPKRKQVKDRFSGKVVPRYSIQYSILFVKKDKTLQEQEIYIENENPRPLMPNSYIKVKISKKRVVEGPEEIKKKSIPDDILKKLD